MPLCKLPPVIKSPRWVPFIPPPIRCHCSPQCPALSTKLLLEDVLGLLHKPRNGVLPDRTMQSSVWRRKPKDRRRAWEPTSARIRRDTGIRRELLVAMSREEASLQKDEEHTEREDVPAPLAQEAKAYTLFCGTHGMRWEVGEGRVLSLLVEITKQV
jgi:hypothetical protein